MKTTRTIIACLILSFSFLSAYPQGRVVRGVVTDQETREKLPGVNVVEMNENDRIINGTITDNNGEFILKTESASGKLMFSYIGYESKNIAVDDKTYLEVALLEKGLEFEEVVVKADRIQTNGFMPVSIRESSASISKINLEGVSEMGATSIEEALAGQLSGLDVSMASGDPGAAVSIQIRGASSINGRNEPMILLNGVIYETDIDDDFEFTSATADDYGGLVDIAPEDIESIEIYKDAAATALYGPKAANGVLAINTKRGKKGPSVISYSFKYTSQDPPDPIPLLNGPDYVLMQLDAQYNRSMGRTNEPPDLSNQEFYPILYQPKRNYEYAWEHSQNTNWIDKVIQRGMKADHNFSISGGGEKASYRMSLGRLTSKGTSIGTGFDRFSTMLTLDYQLSKKLRFDAEFSLTDSEKSDVEYDGNSMLEIAYKKAPNMAIYEMLGPDSASNEYFSAYYNETEDGNVIQNYQGEGDDWINPVAQIDDALSVTNSNRIRTKLGMQYRITPENLKLMVDLSYDINNRDERRFNPQSATGVTDLEREFNYTYHKDQESYGINQTTRLVFNENIGTDHDFIAIAAMSIQSSNSISQVGVSERSPSLVIRNHTSDSPISELDSDLNRYREVGYIFNFRYMFREKFVINPGFRYDGSSRYGLGNKWGFRPLISLAYFVSEENFLKEQKWLDDLKIRASYGQIGKNPDNILETYSLYSSSSSFQYMNINGVAPKNIQLYNLKWELVEKYNVGIDLYAFDNRVTATAEYYTDITSGVLQRNYEIPSSTGYENLRWYNAGIIENSGFEFQASTRIIDRNNINFDVDFNFTINRNRIIEVPDNLAEDDANMLENGNYTSLITIGGGVHAYYGYLFDGVFPTDEDAIARDSEGNPLIGADGQPLLLRFGNAGGYIFRGGDARYRDINHDGLINELDIVQLGNPYPDFHGGFAFRLSLFKSFSVRTAFHYKVGHDIVNETKMNLENMYYKNNQAISVNRRWREPGDITNIPRALYRDGYNWLGSSRFVEDASFLKLRFMSIAYNIPKKAMSNVFLKDLNAFFTIYNLATWTNYTGQNPEVNVASKDVNYIGVDDSKTPPPMDFVIGLNFKF